jgi:hypothetical protein
MATKPLPQDQQDCLRGLAYFQIEQGGMPALPKDQTKEGLKPYNLLLRRGFVIRLEFNDRRFGYRITGSGMDHMVATEPEEFFYPDDSASSVQEVAG